MHDAVNVDDLRKLARRRLPRIIFDAIEGGAGDEITLSANRSAFDRIEFRPRPLADVAKRDLSITVFGEQLSTPIMLAPTGAGRLVRSGADIAIARGAARTDTLYMQSTIAGFPLEDIAKSSNGKLWYQLYLPRDHADTAGLVRRIADAGYKALVITIDTPVFGNRERDVRSKVLRRPPWDPKMLVQGATHPRWAVEFLSGYLGPKQPGSPTRHNLAKIRTSIMSTSYSVTWEDVEHVRQLWKGPLLIKGLMRGDECDRLNEAGVDGVVVSNHGGRQLDGVSATIDVLPEVVDAAAGRFPVFLDGGIRRGNDVAKALALGAAAVFIGRPYLYGLAVGGEDGVVRAIDMLRVELDRAMALLGAATVADLDRSLVATSRQFIPAPATTG